MQIHYALYDSDIANARDERASDQKSLWTWNVDILAYNVRNEFYGSVLAKNLPNTPVINSLRREDFWGGIARFSFARTEWTVCYRFFNAGLYKDKRTGHYIILTAWIKTDEADAQDISKVFDSNAFQHVLATNEYPVPAPPNLSQWITENKTVYTPAYSELSGGGNEEYTGENPLRYAGAQFAADKAKRILSVQIEDSQKGQRAKFTLTPKKKSITKPPVDPPTEGTGDLPPPLNGGGRKNPINAMRVIVMTFFLCVGCGILYCFPPLFRPTHEGGPSGSQTGTQGPSSSQLVSKPSVTADDDFVQQFQRFPIATQVQLFQRLDSNTKEKFVQEWFRQLNPKEQVRELKLLHDIFTAPRDSRTDKGTPEQRQNQNYGSD